MFCKKCGATISDGAAFCDKCGAPVEAGQTTGAFVPPAAPVPPTMSTAPAAAPAQKSKKPLIIGIIVAVIAVVLIGCFALGGSGGGGNNNIVGTWDLTATIDGDDVTPISRGLGYIEFKSNGTVTLSLGADATYTGTYEKNNDLTDRVDSSKGAYDLNLTSLPSGVASISEINGKDGLFVIIPGVKYGMFFEK